MVLLRCACRREFFVSILRGCRLSNCRSISTSDKKKEISETCPPPEAVFKKVPDFSKPLESKGWAGFGLHKTDRLEDLYRLHITYLWTITVMICGGVFIYMYGPDYRREDWAKREAFIRLHEREQLGLVPVDMNYVDPSEVILPPDEILSEEHIII